MSRQTPTSQCAENRAILPKALFAPTLICAALLAALPAEALRTGGSTIPPSSDSWGYTTPTKGNSIEFTEETATVVIFGAYAKVDGETASASENSVTLTRSPLEGLSAAYGGYARINASTETDPTEVPSAGQGDASVKSNHVTLREGSKLKAAFGGTAEVYTLGGGEAEAIDNTVSLSGNSFSEEIRGGFAGIASHGDFSAFANNNTVSLSDSSAKIVYGGWTSAGTNEANKIRLEANNNRVTLTNSTTNESNGNTSFVIGGQSILEAEGYNSATVQVNSNQVELIDSQCLGSVVGGYSLTYTLPSTTVEALDNRVSLSGDSMAVRVFGGIVTNTVTVAGNEDDSQATVSRNHIELSDTAKATMAYGGGAEVYANQNAGKASASAKNNTAHFKGNAETASVYAGEARAYYGQSGMGADFRST